MSEAVVKIMSDIDRLSDAERSEIASVFWQRFGPPDDGLDDPELEALLDSRIDDLESGRVKGVPMEEAFDRMKARRS